jgi:hypothetical protein
VPSILAVRYTSFIFTQQRSRRSSQWYCKGVRLDLDFSSSSSSPAWSLLLPESLDDIVYAFHEVGQAHASLPM